ncbi:MAG: DUF6249 domain-containing protein [Marinifilaceae bacterium]
MIEDLIPMSFFAFILGIIYLNQKHKEKKMLISMGVSPEEINKKRNSSDLDSLKLGLIAIAVSLGIFAGYILSVSTQLAEEAAYFSMIFLFGGIALLVFYFFSQRKDEGDNNYNTKE